MRNTRSLSPVRRAVTAESQSHPALEQGNKILRGPREREARHHQLIFKRNTEELTLPGKPEHKHSVRDHKNCENDLLKRVDQRDADTCG